MNILRGFGDGVRAYSRAFNFIRDNKLSWFYLFPLFLNVILFAFGYSWIADSADSLKSILDGYISSVDYDFINNEYVRLSVAFLLKLIFRISFFLAFMFFGGYIIVAIMSPVFSFLSERTERAITGKDYPFDFKQFLQDVLRGVLLAIRNAVFQLVVAIVLFFVSFIPLMGFVTPFIMFFVSAYFYGFSFMDYAIERKRLGVKDSVRYMRQNKGLVIGNGFVFALLLLVPFCGVLLSAFAANVSVVAGTILVEENTKKEFC